MYTSPYTLNPTWQPHLEVEKQISKNMGANAVQKFIYEIYRDISIYKCLGILLHMVQNEMEMTMESQMDIGCIQGYFGIVFVDRTRMLRTSWKGLNLKAIQNMSHSIHA